MKTPCPPNSGGFSKLPSFSPALPKRFPRLHSKVIVNIIRELAYIGIRIKNVYWTPIQLIHFNADRLWIFSSALPGVFRDRKPHTQVVLLFIHIQLENKFQFSLSNAIIIIEILCVSLPCLQAHSSTDLYTCIHMSVFIYIYTHTHCYSDINTNGFCELQWGLQIQVTDDGCITMSCMDFTI